MPSIPAIQSGPNTPGTTVARGLALAATACLVLIGPWLPAHAAPAAEASGVTAPTVRGIPLSGIDSDVLRVAPAPSADTDGSVGAATVTDRPAIAATVSTVAAPAALVAVSADKPFAEGTSVQVRTLEAGGWSAWEHLETSGEHGPDPDSDEAKNARYGSDPLTTSDATKVQVRIDTPTGSVPTGTQLTVVHAPQAASDADITPTAGSVGAAAASVGAAAVSQPPIITRAQWGADESWRGHEPSYTDTIKAGFLHHTASTSSYTMAGAAAQVRAIYAYHTKSLGHSDIDYNYVVDRFGRLYEGRYGGIDRAVLGAHTAGFNVDTFAVVALGNYETTKPVASELAKVKESVARLFAWKFSAYGVSPTGTAHLLSAGYIRPTRYPRGVYADIPTISSHQMVNYTSCPGKYLQSELPAIRTLAGKYAAGSGAGTGLSALTPATKSVAYGSSSVSLSTRADRALTWQADIFSPCSESPVRTYSGRAAKDGAIAVTWDLESSGKRVLPATYRVVVSGEAEDGTAVAAVTSQVTVTPVAGVVWGPCANVSRIATSTASGTSVQYAAITYPSSTSVVLTAPADASKSALAAGLAAAPLARHLSAPLLLNRGGTLAASVAAELKRRSATQVIVVGSTSVVPTSVAKAIAARGIKVTRIAGKTTAQTAAAVARRFPAGTPAVVVSVSEPAHALAGSALATARNNPVLLAGASSISATTKAALAGRASVTVAVSTDLSTKTVRAVMPSKATWVRLTGRDEVAASVAISKAAPVALSKAVLLPADPDDWASAPAAITTGGVLLFTSRSTLSASVGEVLRARQALATVLSPVLASKLGDPVLGAASRELGATTQQAAYRIGQAKADPEPVRAGATLTVRASIQVPDGVGGWKAAPAGRSVTLQFKPTGSTTYTAAKTTTSTVAGSATITIAAQRSGAWRIAVGGVTGPGDAVAVK